MIAIIDPAHFLATGDDEITPQEASGFEARLRELARICRATGARIPDIDWYWAKLQRELVRPLYARVGRYRGIIQGLDELRALAQRVHLPAEAPESARMWGVRPLFEWTVLATEWFPVMERLVLGCALNGEETVLIPRLFIGRNVVRHEADGCVLIEKTRWSLYVHASGAPPTAVRCVTSQRNIDVPWTARFDERLPCESDGGRFPFCPPDRWWLRDTDSRRTSGSKPAWMDRRGNGWALPRIANSYHWDVFIEDPALEADIGLGQLNIVRWGAPAAEGTPGDIHHVPASKRARLKNTSGWSCA